MRPGGVVKILAGRGVPFPLGVRLAAAACLAAPPPLVAARLATMMDRGVGRGMARWGDSGQASLVLRPRLAGLIGEGLDTVDEVDDVLPVQPGVTVGLDLSPGR